MLALCYHRGAVLLDESGGGSVQRRLHKRPQLAGVDRSGTRRRSTARNRNRDDAFVAHHESPPKGIGHAVVGPQSGPVRVRGASAEHDAFRRGHNPLEELVLLRLGLG